MFWTVLLIGFIFVFFVLIGKIGPGPTFLIIGMLVAFVLLVRSLRPRQGQQGSSSYIRQQRGRARGRIIYQPRRTRPLAPYSDEEEQFIIPARRPHTLVARAINDDDDFSSPPVPRLPRSRRIPPQRVSISPYQQGYPARSEEPLRTSAQHSSFAAPPPPDDEAPQAPKQEHPRHYDHPQAQYPQ